MSPAASTGTTPDGVRIATRGSGLARWQAAHVTALIARIFPDFTITTSIIRTSGDRILDAPFAQIGGKGIFVKEIEDALLSGGVDIAVHSMKDMPTELPAGLGIGAFVERASPLDALCTTTGSTLKTLPLGARVGTSSIRRSAQLLHHRPDLEIVPLRGNVDTRVRKLTSEDLAAIVLAQAGLERMGLEKHISEVLGPDISLPAPGQGIVAIECRMDDPRIRAILAHINHQPTQTAGEAERSFLRELEGGCQVPAGCLATLDGDTLKVEGLIADPLGSRVLRETVSGSAADHEELGAELARRLLAAGGREIMAALERDAQT